MNRCSRSGVIRIAALAAVLPVLACDGGARPAVSDVALAEIDTVISLESGLLAAPVDVAVDGAGRVYVLDEQFARVLVWTDPGRTPVLYGGEGEGPGEFKGPATMSVSNDTIRIVELGNGRVQVLASDGTHVRGYPLPAAFPGGISLSPSGRLAVPTQGFREDFLVLLFDRDGTPAGRVGAPVSPPHEMWDMTEISSEIERNRVPASLRNMSLPVIEDDGSLWLVLVAEGVVRRYDAEGALLWSLALDSPELDAIKERFFVRNRELTSPGFVQLSYVSDAVIVDDGLWLLLNTPPDDPAVVLVLTADGRLERRIRTAAIHGARNLAVDAQRRRIYFTVPAEASLMAVTVPD